MADEAAGSGEEMGLLPFDDGSMGRAVRKAWHEGRWFVSVIDVIAILTDSDAPAKYWTAMKARIQDEGFRELSTKCRRLKMRALDGKMRLTDAADTETMLRISMSIPSPKAEPVRQWLAQIGAQKLDEAAAALDEHQRRLLLRGEIARQNTQLNAAASSHGLLSGRDFAIFHDHGYRGLYAGETAGMIAARKGVTQGRILDHMSSTELAYNLFRVSLTDDKLRQLADEGFSGKGIANDTHYMVGREVRATIERVGGTLPERLPTPLQSIQQLEAAEAQRVKAQLQPSLFQALSASDGEEKGGEENG